MTAVLDEAPATLVPADEGTGFSWSCRTVEAERGRVVRACDTGGSDRDEYAVHCKAHGRRATKSAYQRWKPWKPPRPVKEYAPKPGDPGQRITWGRVTDGHWEGREFNGGRVTVEGTWVPWACETRTGTIWSAGTTGSELWVCPDDDPQRPVLVKRQGRKFSFDAREGDLREVVGWGEHARLAVLRGEDVRRRGIYPVVDLVFKDHGTTRTYVKWHTHPACPKAQGKERYDQETHGKANGYVRFGESRSGGLYGGWPWTPTDVAAALVRDVQPPSELCPDCITGLDTEKGRDGQ